MAEKCSADVVTACDRGRSNCGFCREHCPYEFCPTHAPMRNDSLTSPSHKCVKESKPSQDKECPEPYECIIPEARYKCKYYELYDPDDLCGKHKEELDTFVKY